MDESCEKPPYIDHNADIKSGERGLIDIEISADWTLRPKNSESVIDQIFQFSVFASLVIISCYLFIVHKLVYYETLDSANLKYQIDYLLKLTEHQRNLIESLSMDIETFRTQLQTHSAQTSDHVRRRRSIIDIKECNRLRKRNRRNCTRTIETVAVQFRGYNTEAFAESPIEGALGPWFEGPEVGRTMKSMGVTLKESDRKVEISKAGLYFIYSQVTYLSERTMNSYSINVISTSNVTGKNINKAVALCSTVGQSDYEAELSCYTSVARLLYPKDIVYLQQNQKNRTILFEDNMTYFGLIFLAES